MQNLFIKSFRVFLFSSVAVSLIASTFGQTDMDQTNSLPQNGGFLSTPAEPPLAQIIEVQDENGKQVGIVTRPATIDDINLQHVILKHPKVQGIGLALIEVVSQTNGVIQDFLPYGHPNRSFNYWNDLTQKIVALIDSVSQDPGDLDGSGLPESVQFGAPSPTAKPFVVRHGFDGYFEISASSAALEQVKNGTSILYQMYPNQITAVGTIGAEGLVLLDELGGRQGVRYIGLAPLGVVGVIIPNNPKTFAKNVSKLAVNPVLQSQFYAKALGDVIHNVPGGQQLSSVFGTFRVALSQMGNTPIMHTTPNHVLQTWTQDPRRAIVQTLGPIGERRIGGTTIDHATRAWTSDPKSAFIKTFKSIF